MRLTDAQAATFVQSYMTARFALEHRARAQAGQWLLVLGAGGGVGLGAVDVGSAMGLQVIAAASSQDKRAAATAHGAVAGDRHDDRGRQGARPRAGRR